MSTHSGCPCLTLSKCSLLQRPPFSLTHPIPYSHTEATLTIPMTFCLVLINISALFPSEELPARQPAPPDQPSVISSDFLPFFTIFHTHPQEASKHHAAVLGGTLAVTCMSPCLGPLISPAPSLSVLLPGKAILLTWSAARVAVPLTSVIPSFLSDLFPSLPCPSSDPLICSFHYFHLIRLRISHLISAHFLLLYLSFLAQIDCRLALFLTLHYCLMNYEV